MNLPEGMVLPCAQVVRQKVITKAEAKSKRKNKVCFIAEWAFVMLCCKINDFFYPDWYKSGFFS